MKSDLISVIVPVYNSEKFLNECIISIMKQTYENIEIILVDDGSTDKSGLLCDDFAKRDERIKVFHLKNGGVSKARNFGITRAKGKWISFVDSDDCISEDYCMALINVIEENTDLVIGRTISFNGSKENEIEDGYKGGEIDSISNSKEKEELFKAIFIDNRKLIRYPHISTCSAKLIRKSIIIENDIKYDSNMFLYEDAYFNMNVIYRSNIIKLINKKIYFYRNNENSSTRKIDERIIEQYNYIYQNIEEFNKKYELNLEKFYDYFKIKNLNAILTNYYKINRADDNYVKKICNLDIYQKALSKIAIKDLPKKRKALVILYRMKMYKMITKMYCKIK